MSKRCYETFVVVVPSSCRISGVFWIKKIFKTIPCIKHKHSKKTKKTPALQTCLPTSSVPQFLVNKIFSRLQWNGASLLGGDRGEWRPVSAQATAPQAPGGAGPASGWLRFGSTTVLTESCLTIPHPTHWRWSAVLFSELNCLLGSLGSPWLLLREGPWLGGGGSCNFSPVIHSFPA